MAVSSPYLTAWEDDLLELDQTFGLLKILKGAQASNDEAGSAAMSQNNAGELESLIDPTPSPDGGEFLVNTSTNSVHSQTVVSELADGGFVIVWKSGGDGGLFGVFGQRYNADGTASGGEFLINTHTFESQEAPSVASLADGGFVVTWRSWLQDGSGFGIYAQRYSADGTKVGGEFQVSTQSLGSQIHSSVTGLADGGFIFSWASTQADGSQFGIVAQKFNADGTRNGDEFVVNTVTTLSDQLLPSIGAFSDGGYVIIWESFGGDGMSFGIVGQRFNPDGTRDGAEFVINTTTASDQRFSSVATLEDDGFVVTWSSLDQDGSGYGVFGQRYNSDGTPSGTEFQINTNTANDQKHPSVTALADGGFLVTWSSFNQDGDAWGVYGQRFDADGNRVGEEFRANETTSFNQFQDFDHREGVVALADGTVVIVWSGFGIGDNDGVFARLFSLPDLPGSNNDPDAQDDVATTGEDMSAIIDLLANDTDADGDTLTLIGFTQGLNGSVIDNGDGTVTYTPNPNISGGDSFTYTIEDGNGGSDSATVAVTIIPVNDAPQAAGDAYSTDEDMALNIAAAGVLTNDNDVDGDSLTAVLTSDVVHGTLTLNADGGFTYIPEANFDGIDSFTYKANDGDLDSNEVTVFLTVNSANDAPVANADSVSVNEDAFVVGNVLSNDTDIDEDDLIVTGVNGETPGSSISGTYGTLTLMSDGSFTYNADQDILDVLDPGTAGIFDAFEYDISDGNGGVSSSLLTITIEILNDGVVISQGRGAGTLIGGDGDDLLLGGRGNDVLNGGEGGDQLFGENGDDLLSGGASFDLLDGGKGNDTMDGGDGDDVLFGGQGDDLMTGGEGRDIFAFTEVNKSEGSDVITDFEVGHDSIYLAEGLSVESTVEVASGTELLLSNGGLVLLEGVFGLNGDSSNLLVNDLPVWV